MRARYLFDLAAVCHCPPSVVDALTVEDFARLVTGLDIAAQQAQARAAQEGLS